MTESSRRWTFYDAHVVAPVRYRNAGELAISIEDDDADVYGSFAIEFIDLSGQPSPQLKAFDDAWKALASTPIVERLAAMPEGSTQADIEAMLIDIGMTDITAELASGDSLSVCGSCNGRGYIRPMPEMSKPEVMTDPLMKWLEERRDHAKRMQEPEHGHGVDPALWYDGANQAYDRVIVYLNLNT